MGNAPPVKKQTEVERLKELAEANFHKTHEFKKSESSSVPETNTEDPSATPDPNRAKVDWDNIQDPTKHKLGSEKSKNSASEVILDGKIKSVAQINWKYDEMNPEAHKDHVTVYDAMEEYDKKLEGIKHEQSLKQKELDAIEAAERERLRRERELDENSSLYEHGDGANENGDYSNIEGEELMLKKTSSMMDGEGEEEDEGPDPFFEEENTLFEIYNYSQPWRDDIDIIGWNEGVEVTAWSGITCGKPVTKQSLKTSNQSLSGGVSFNEGGGEVDEALELHSSTGTIDNAYTDRGFVRRLYLDDYCLQAGGRLPQTGWDKLTSIKILSLSHNQLGGDIPIELGLCKTLQVLNLSCNQLCGDIPVELSSLSSLTHLWLYANQLEGQMPQEIFSSEGCTKLVSLRLKRNCLTGEIPLGVGSLNHLEEFDVEENRLNGSLPETFTKLTKLKVLRVANNELSGPLPVHFLEVMSTLKDLRFYHNKFDQHTTSKMAVMRTVSTSDGFGF